MIKDNANTNFSVTCRTRLLYYTDIFRPVNNRHYKEFKVNFSGVFQELVSEIAKYITKINIENIQNDVFEFNIDLIDIVGMDNNNWRMSIFQSYRPFNDFILLFKNDSNTIQVNSKGGYVDKSLYKNNDFDNNSTFAQFGLEILKNI
jgi:hypothetical protein